MGIEIVAIVEILAEHFTGFQLDERKFEVLRGFQDSGQVSRHELILRRHILFLFLEFDLISPVEKGLDHLSVFFHLLRAAVPEDLVQIIVFSGAHEGW